MRKLLVAIAICSALLITGCGNHGSVIASASNESGRVDVYRSGSRYYYEFVIYDIDKDKDKVYESGKADSLDDIADKYGVVFD